MTAVRLTKSQSVSQSKILAFHSAMTDLELWAFACVVFVFFSILSYAVILVKDQMIIQVNMSSTFTAEEQLLRIQKKIWGGWHF